MVVVALVSDDPEELSVAIAALLRQWHFRDVTSAFCPPPGESVGSPPVDLDASGEVSARREGGGNDTEQKSSCGSLAGHAHIPIASSDDEELDETFPQPGAKDTSHSSASTALLTGASEGDASPAAVPALAGTSGEIDTEPDQKMQKKLQLSAEALPFVPPFPVPAHAVHKLAPVVVGNMYDALSPGISKEADEVEESDLADDGTDSDMPLLEQARALVEDCSPRALPLDRRPGRRMSTS